MPRARPSERDEGSTLLQQVPGQLDDLSSASDPSTYVLVKYERHRNIFRIPLH